MSDAILPPGYLGPATERLLAEAFADAVTLTGVQAAKLLGMDEKTLRAAAKSGLIGSVPTGGGSRRYTETDLRLYLARPRDLPAKKEAAPCPSINRLKAASGSTTSSSVGPGFMARRGKLRDAPPRRRKGASVARSPKGRTAQPPTSP